MKTSKNRKSTPWSQDDKKAALSYFANNIKKSKLPGKQECMNCMQKFPNRFSGRTWKNLKDFVRNTITSFKM